MLRTALAALAGMALPFAAAQNLAAPKPAVYVAAPGGDWQPADADAAEGRIEVRVDAAQTAGGRLRLLVHPPEGVDIHDRTPPRITGLKVDGKPKAAAPEIALGRGDWQPGRIAVGVEDVENAVSEATIAFLVDGKPHGWGDPLVSREAGTYTLHVPDLDLGVHSAAFLAADTSPQRNEVRVAVTWEHSIADNYCLATAGATLAADSCFENYPDLTPLQDGRTALPGDHCRNDVSWASAETPEAHWVEVDFGRVRRVTRVSLCWAYYDGLYHTSRNYEVQVPDGGDWRTVWAAPPEGVEAGPFTTARWGFAVTRKIRIYQPPGGGPPHRPNLLWLAEVMAQ